MKREWQYAPENFKSLKGTTTTDYALWALVERLEALVGIMDELEQVGDVIANHLSFGGQPVGEGTHPANWQCQKTKDCVLFNGHQGQCIRPYDPVTLDACLAVHPATGEKCMLLAGHDSICAFEEPGTHDGEVPGGYNAVPQPVPIIPARICQCMKPVFVGGSDLCEKCGYPPYPEGTK